MENKLLPPTPLDEKAQTPELMALKAIIPYMEPSAGKMAAIAVKLLEAQELLRCFESEIAVSAAGYAQAERSRRMLAAVRPYCDEKKAETIGLLEKMLEMREMAEMMSAVKAMKAEEAEEQNGQL